MSDKSCSPQSASFTTSMQRYTLDEVKSWVKTMGRKGMYPPKTAQLRVQALIQLTSVLDPDDPQDAATVLADIENLGARWARANTGKAETMRTYVGRAKYALQDFLAFQADPGAFKGRSGPAKSTREKQSQTINKPKPVELVAAGPPSNSQPPIASPPPVTQRSSMPELRSYPLDSNGRTFLYGLPDGVHFREIAKIFCHLMSFAPDFDPTNSTHADFYFKALSAVNRAQDDTHLR